MIHIIYVEHSNSSFLKFKYQKLPTVLTFLINIVWCIKIIYLLHPLTLHTFMIRYYYFLPSFKFLNTLYLLIHFTLDWKSLVAYFYTPIFGFLEKMIIFYFGSLIILCYRWGPYTQLKHKIWVFFINTIGIVSNGAIITNKNCFSIYHHHLSFQFQQISTNQA